MDVQQIKESKSLKALLTIVTIAFIVLMFPHGESIDSEVQINSIWIKSDLIATQTFEILKDPIVIEREREIATNSVYPVFIKDNKVLGQVLVAFELNSNKLTDYIRLVTEHPDSVFNSNDIGLSSNSFGTFINISEGSYGSNYSLKQINKFCTSEIKRIYRRGYINKSYPTIAKDTISVRDGKFEISYLKERYYDHEVLTSYLDQKIFNSFNQKGEIKNAVKEYLTFVLKPNIRGSISSRNKHNIPSVKPLKTKSQNA